MDLDDFIDNDLLWIQSSPSISALFYYKYISHSHTLYCPDQNGETLTPRKLAKNLVSVFESSKKKVAVHFMNPCSVKRRDTTFSLILKTNPDLSCHCLSIPTTNLQHNLLLGWSAEIMDTEWQKKCMQKFNPEAFIEFMPPTHKSSRSAWNEFSNEFVVSKKIFSKKALIVDMTFDMVSFDSEKGLRIKESAENSIRGWMNTVKGKPRTLVWIFDEKSLFEETLRHIVHGKKAALLNKYRKLLYTSIESFADTMPIYCYLSNYFKTDEFKLSQCLAQIQHRHHLCLSKSFLLEQSEKEFNSEYMRKMKTITLDSFAVFSDAKWESLYKSYAVKVIKRNGYDEINYISPDMLDLDSSVDHYQTPLLSTSTEYTETKTEVIDENLHTLSAQSSTVVEKWVEVMIKAAKEEDLDLSEKILQKLTEEKAKEYIGQESTWTEGEYLVDTLSDAQYNFDGKVVTLSLMAEQTYLLTFKISKIAEISYASCSCPLGDSGQCKHAAAAFKYVVDKHQVFVPATPVGYSQLTQSLSSSSDASSAKKRSFTESEDDGEASTTDSGSNQGGTKRSKSTGTVYNTALEISDSFCATGSVQPEASNSTESSQKRKESTDFSIVANTAVAVTETVNSNSYSSTSLPSIPSDAYGTASSKSFSSRSVYYLSSGSWESKGSNSSGNASVPQENTDFREFTTEIDPIQEITQETPRYSSDEQHHADDEQTQPYNPDDHPTQIYHSQSIRTIEYNAGDSSSCDDLSLKGYTATTSKHFDTADTEATQAYNPDTQRSEDATQLYDVNAAPTQADLEYNTGNSSFDDLPAQVIDLAQDATIDLDDSDEEEQQGDLNETHMAHTEEDPVFYTANNTLNTNNKNDEDEDESGADSTREWLSELI